LKLKILDEKKTVNDFDIQKRIKRLKFRRKPLNEIKIGNF
jgi:hypothetical protein